ncbi:MAG TPA: ABC transporter ATP-binding protein [Bdellovibrionales bacterium]|nr:ABC transporter ATP-binding protein [Bdellovibrionales bacterium]
MNKAPVLLQSKGITKVYQTGASRLQILKGIDLEIHEGEALSITGASGAGKSTLLHILGTLDRPTTGQMLFRGKDLARMPEDDLARFRNASIGFVFQFHHLLKEFTALENVMMPGRIAGLSARESERAARELLSLVGLGKRLNHYPNELSGGEQQRVAVARALVRKPQILLADEPTGNLDTANGQLIQELFFQLKKERGVTLVVVTHDATFARKFPRTIEIKDGRFAG